MCFLDSFVVTLSYIRLISNAFKVGQQCCIDSLGFSNVALDGWLERGMYFCMHSVRQSREAKYTAAFWTSLIN